jgi:squalene-associated FAD-dependent desaturase
LTALHVAVVGAGWAGLAAAVHARRAGHAVSVFEMAPQAGGRARAVVHQGLLLDNGQHILIGAYRATLELMALLGIDEQRVLHRMPLALRFADGSGLQLRAGAAVPALLRGVLGCRGWRWRDKGALLWAATRWAAARFECSPELTVDRLCAGLPAALRRDLIDPLCVAALNTPAASASAAVFLRVLRDALFSAPGSADLLLPRQPLDALLPRPAAAWLQTRGSTLRLGHRVMALERDGACRWRLDGQAFDRVVLACTATEAARLCQPLAPEWSAQAAALRYEPIVTVYARAAGARLPTPMTALHADASAPAQFVFDLGALGGPTDVLAFVISGAREWVERGLQATAQATLARAESAFPAGTWQGGLQLVHVAAEKRATFQCTPGLVRPAARILPGLLAAADYVHGPYPATLESAVLAGRRAAALLHVG